VFSDYNKFNDSQYSAKNKPKYSEINDDLDRKIAEIRKKYQDFMDHREFKPREINIERNKYQRPDITRHSYLNKDENTYDFGVGMDLKLKKISSDYEKPILRDNSVYAFDHHPMRGFVPSLRKLHSYNEG